MELTGECLVPPAIDRSLLISYAVLLEVLVLSEGQLVGLFPEEVVAHDPSILLVHLTIKKQLLCLMKEKKPLHCQAPDRV